MSDRNSFVYRISNGAIAGVIGTSIIFPIDISKTRMQNNKSSLNSTFNPYKNILTTMRHIAKNDGIIGLYRGLFVNLLFVMPEKAIKLSANDQIRTYLGSKNGSYLTLEKEIMAGAMAGSLQVIVTTPMEFLKIQKQMFSVSNSPKTKSLSTISLIMTTVRNTGIKGLYKGFNATLMRDVFFSMIYFSSFSSINSKLQTNSKMSKFQCNLCGGFISGAFAAYLATPFDVIKTRIQTNNASPSMVYNGWVDCLSKTLNNEGYQALFKGSIPRVLVVAPLFAIAQSVYFFGIAQRLSNLF